MKTLNFRKIVQLEKDWVKEYAHKEAESVIKNYGYKVKDVRDLEKKATQIFWGTKNKEQSVAYKYWGLKIK